MQFRREFPTGILQGLKPSSFLSFRCGTTEVVPCYKAVPEIRYPIEVVHCYKAVPETQYPIEVVPGYKADCLPH